MSYSNVMAVDPSLNSTALDTSGIRSLWYQLDICEPSPYAFVFYYSVKVRPVRLDTLQPISCF